MPPQLSEMEPHVAPASAQLIGVQPDEPELPALPMALPAEPALPDTPPLPPPPSGLAP
jgi:hypothetical protein